MPKQLGLKDILNNFITYRKTTIKRKSLFNKEKISKRLKILDGYLIAYKYLDEIIKIIRKKEKTTHINFLRIGLEIKLKL